MRLLIACEFSGVVRRAFRERGHDAWSCDLLPAEDGSEHHIQGDVLSILYDGWDGVIAHPPCTRLTVAGARWFKGKEAEQAEAIAFVEAIWNAGIPRTAIENPIGVLSTRSTLGKPTQIIQPWQFGHGETKATCLWLRGFPKLIPTNMVSGREARIHRMAPSPDRWKERSRTYAGIAKAMAEQWGPSLVVDPWIDACRLRLEPGLNIVRGVHHPRTTYIVDYIHDGNTHIAINVDLGKFVAIDVRALTPENFERLKSARVEVTNA